jgi:hypothetical protein
MRREMRFLLYELLAERIVFYCAVVELLLMVARWKDVCRLARIVEAKNRKTVDL